MVFKSLLDVATSENKLLPFLFLTNIRVKGTTRLHNSAAMFTVDTRLLGSLASELSWYLSRNWLRFVARNHYSSLVKLYIVLSLFSTL